MKTDWTWVKYVFQLLFGMPILMFALGMIYLDVTGQADVGKWGYAFFASLVTNFVTYFFRKGIKKDDAG